MSNSESLLQAYTFVATSQATSIETGEASTHAQIASAFAMIAIAEELKEIKGVMMDYVEEKCRVEYTRRQ